MSLFEHFMGVGNMIYMCSRRSLYGWYHSGEAGGTGPTRMRTVVVIMGEVQDHDNHLHAAI